ncbi:hypothetical protein NL676_016877 [Syzygium grande]|nr:hypothetical protein NL676_016877 [Syzygium grande]
MRPLMAAAAGAVVLLVVLRFASLHGRRLLLGFFSCGPVFVHVDGVAHLEGDVDGTWNFPGLLSRLGRSDATNVSDSQTGSKLISYSKIDF